MIRATETKATRSIYKVMLRVEAYRARRGCSGRVFESMVFFFVRSLPSVCLPLATKSFKILCVPVRGGGGDGGSTFDRRTNTVRTPSTEAGKAIFLPPFCSPYRARLHCVPMAFRRTRTMLARDMSGPLILLVDLSRGDDACDGWAVAAGCRPEWS